MLSTPCPLLLLERFERDGGWAADGALSAAAWTAQRTGSARAGLRSRRRQGAALARLPAVGAEARTGRLSTEHLRAIGDCVRRHPDLAADHEAFWLEQAEVLDAEGFRLAARHWLAAAADADSPDRSEPGTGESDQVSHLHVSRTFEGWLRVDGLFAPGDADWSRPRSAPASTGRCGPPATATPASPAGRSPRCGPACSSTSLAQTMRHEPSDASAPDRYRVAVVVQHGQPTAPRKPPATPAPTGSCSAPQGEVLDVGRQTNRWPVAIRRAITVRDRGCVFPGCDRPPSWTDIHHCTPWNEGGSTSSTTARSCAGATTRSSTTTAGASRSTTANRPPEHPTARHSPSRWQPDALAS